MSHVRFSQRLWPGRGRVWVTQAGSEEEHISSGKEADRGLQLCPQGSTKVTWQEALLRGTLRVLQPCQPCQPLAPARLLWLSSIKYLVYLHKAVWTWGKHHHHHAG